MSSVHVHTLHPPLGSTDKQTHHRHHIGRPRRHDEIARDAITRDTYLGQLAAKPCPPYRTPGPCDCIHSLLRNEVFQERGGQGQTLAFAGLHSRPTPRPLLKARVRVRVGVALRVFYIISFPVLSSRPIRGSASPSSQDPERPARSLRFPSTRLTPP